MRPEKLIIVTLCLLPLMWLVVRMSMERLGVSPVDTITSSTGHWAMRLIVATLAVKPLSKITGWNRLVSFRKSLGLLAFFYATLHLLTFVGLEYFFAVSLMVADAVRTPHIIIGFFTYMSMIPLAATSTRRWIKRLSPAGWNNLHRLVYISSFGALFHYYLQVKVVTTDLIIYAVLVIVLIGYRLIQYLYRAKPKGLPPKSP